MRLSSTPCPDAAAAAERIADDFADDSPKFADDYADPLTICDFKLSDSACDVTVNVAIAPEE